MAAILFLLTRKKPFTTANLQHAEVSNEGVTPDFTINYLNNAYEIACGVKLPLAEMNVNENESETPLFFQYHNQFFTWQRIEDIMLVDQFLPTGKITIDARLWSSKLQEFILPLAKEYNVNFGNLKIEVKDEKPELKILLKEKGDYLVFQPVFTYKGYDVRSGDKEKIVLPLAEKLLVVHRNLDAEKELLSKIENLHSQFIRPVDTDTLALKGVDVLKNNWFFLFVDAMKDLNVQVFGFDALRNFRFNTAKPSTKIYISSNTDWFDAKIEIQFGEQKVTVEDVKSI
jgi:non-specific serine/threonine protein kinase